MKKIYNLQRTFLLALLLGFWSTEVSSQTIISLDAPAKKGYVNQISIGSGNYAPGTIVNGSVPPNSSSKPVLVFIHGYTGDADTWFSDNDMYEKAYNDGYRTSFVTVHPDRSMWTNGELFSRQLQNICNHYGVQKVVVVAHSKGGIDTDAALVHYGSHARVDRVITLGTPHFGTPLADLAQSGWVWWLSAIFGQRNEATYVMQTGYMSYYRSITDSKNTNAPAKFRTYGGWKYYGSLWVSGVYLSTNGGASWNGGNDGVVNYPSSRRPGGTTLFGGYGDSRTAFNHYDLSLGKNVWTYVKAQLPSSLYREAAPSEDVAPAYNPVAVVRSNYQILSGEQGTATFSLEKDAGPLHLDVRQAQSEDIGLSVNGKDISWHQSRRQGQASDGILGSYSLQYQLEPSSGQVSITASAPYVAILTAAEGGWAELSTDLNEQKQVYQAGETMNMRVYLQNAKGQPVTGATVAGSLRRTANLQGEASNIESELLEVTFTPAAEAGYYTYTSPPISSSGVYNISLQASSSELQRSLVHSVAFAEPQHKQSTLASPFALQAWPNPTSSALNLRYQLQEDQQLTIEIFDVAGRMMYQQALYQPAGMHHFKWSGRDGGGALVTPGTYFYKLNGKHSAESGKFIIVR